jgi:hypothetical protein
MAQDTSRDFLDYLLRNKLYQIHPVVSTYSLEYLFTAHYCPDRGLVDPRDNEEIPFGPILAELKILLPSRRWKKGLIALPRGNVATSHGNESDAGRDRVNGNVPQGASVHHSVGQDREKK